LVLTRSLWISWPEGGPGGPRDRALRRVSEFRPWHMVSGVRVLEQEEKNHYGL